MTIFKKDFTNYKQLCKKEKLIILHYISFKRKNKKVENITNLEVSNSFLRKTQNDKFLL